jgi:hypothetical protein
MGAATKKKTSNKNTVQPFFPAKEEAVGLSFVDILDNIITTRIRGETEEKRK